MGYTDPTGYSRESREAWFSYGRGTREDKSYRRAPRERKSNQAESNGANSQQEPSPKPSSPSFQSPKVERTSKTKIDDATINDAAFSVGDTVYHNEGEDAEAFLERTATRWTEITNEEESEVSSFLYHNDESCIYAVVTYLSGLPQLFLNRDQD
jgi:hypothetical protein